MFPEDPCLSKETKQAIHTFLEALQFIYLFLLHIVFPY